jgi:hypothetical protein
MHKSLFAKVPDFLRKKDWFSEVWRKLQIIIAFANTRSVPQKPTAFFNLSFANHMLSDSSGGIKTYLPLWGSAAAEGHLFSNN